MKRLLAALLILILFLAPFFVLLSHVPRVSAAVPWLGSWDKRIEITIEAAEVDSTLTWFPVMLHVSSASGRNNTDVTSIFDELGSESRKIAVTSSDGLSELKIEVERWNSTAEMAWLWVSNATWQISSATNTTIYFYYDVDHADNSNVGLNADGSAATESVWNTDFKAVYHMGTGSINESDSTSNDHDLEKFGTIYQVEGKVGYCRDLDGSNDFFRFDDGDMGIGSDPFTYEAFTNHTTGGRIFYTYHTTNNKGLYLSTLSGSSESQIFVRSTNDTNYKQSGVPVNQEHYIAATRESDDEIILYQNLTWTTSGDYNPGSVDGGSFGYIGCDYAFGADYDGTLDELRVSSVARSQDWLETNNATVEDDLVYWGSETHSPTYPQYSSVGVTSQIANTTTTFHANWSLEAPAHNLSYYIFGSNLTGSFVNETAEPFHIMPYVVESSDTGGGLTPGTVYAAHPSPVTGRSSYGQGVLLNNTRAHNITGFSCKMSKTGSPNFNLSVGIFGVSGANPSSMPNTTWPSLANSTNKINSSTLTGSYVWYNFTFAGDFVMQAMAYYHFQVLVVDYISGSIANRVDIQLNDASGDPDPYNDGNAASYYSNAWDNVSSIYDLEFQLWGVPIGRTWSNYTAVLPSTIGITISWQVWANSTAQNWNTTGLQTFIIQGINISFYPVTMGKFLIYSPSLDPSLRDVSNLDVSVEYYIYFSSWTGAGWSAPVQVVEIPNPNATRYSYQRKVWKADDGYYWLTFFNRTDKTEYWYYSADGGTWTESSHTVAYGQYPYSPYDVVYPSHQAAYHGAWHRTGSGGVISAWKPFNSTGGTITVYGGGSLGAMQLAVGSVTSCISGTYDLVAIRRNGTGTGDCIRLQRAGISEDFDTSLQPYGEGSTGGTQILSYKTSDPYDFLVIAKAENRSFYYNTVNYTDRTFHNAAFLSMGVSGLVGFNDFCAASEAQSAGDPERVHFVFQNSTGLFYMKFESDAWGSVTNLGVNGSYPTMNVDDSGTLIVTYVLNDGRLAYLTNTGSWGSQSIMPGSQRFAGFCSSNHNEDDGEILLVWTARAGSMLAFPNSSRVTLIGAPLNTSYYWLNFTWDGGGNSTTNYYNFTLDLSYEGFMFYCNFAAIPSPTPGVSMSYVLAAGILLCFIAVPLIIIFLRRH